MVYQRTNAHIKSTSTPFTGPWTCNVCHEQFVNPKAHVDHMGSHSTDYPSSCLLCLQRFKTSNDLASHDCVATNKIVRNTTPRPLSAVIPIPPPIQKLVESPSPPENTAEENLQLTPVSTPLTATPTPSSPFSPSSDGPDEDSLRSFEAAENPRVRELRSRSSSFEANNNQEGDCAKAFIIQDPWQAATAVIIEDEPRLPPPSPPKTPPPCSNKSTTPSPSRRHRKDIVRNFIIDAAGHRVGKRRITPNSRYFREGSPPLPTLQKILPNSVLPSGPLQKRPVLRILEVGVSSESGNRTETSLSGQDAKSRKAIPVAAVDLGTVGTLEGEKIGRHTQLEPQTPPPPRLYCPQMDIYAGGEENFENFGEAPFLVEATPNGEGLRALGFEEEEEFGGEEEEIFPLKEMKCVPCRLRFVDEFSWKSHLISNHIKDARPEVIMKKIREVDVAPGMTFRVSRDPGGNLRISQRPEYNFDSDSNSRGSLGSAASVSRTSPGVAAGGELSNDGSSCGSESRKEGLKLTLCRRGREGQYELKRKSTDSTSSGNFEEERIRPQISPKEARRVSVEGTGGNQGEEGMEVEVSRAIPCASPPPSPPAPPAEEEEVEEVIPPVVLEETMPPSPPKEAVIKPSSSGVLGFKRRFQMAVQSVRKDVQLRRKLLLSSARVSEPVNVPPTPVTVPVVPALPVEDEEVIPGVPEDISDKPVEDVDIVDKPDEDISDKPEEPIPDKPEEEVIISDAPLEIPEALEAIMTPENDRSESQATAVEAEKTVPPPLPAPPAVEGGGERRGLSVPSLDPEETRPEDNATERMTPTEPEAVTRSPEEKTGDGGSPKEVSLEGGNGGQEEKEKEEERPGGDEDDNRLVIADPEETGKETRVEEEETREETQERSPVAAVELEVTKEKEDDKEEEKGGEEEEDFRCPQCKEQFTCDDEVHKHFSEKHVRLVPPERIIHEEPESPFPVIQMGPSSSIFEDEVEESEPYPVEENQRTSSPGNNPRLSNLLNERRCSDDRAPGVVVGGVPEQLVVAPIISSYMHGLERGAALNVVAQGGTLPPRPAVYQAPPRGVPVTRPPLSLAPQDYLSRQPRPPHRITLPYRSNFPQTLHQALVNASQPSPPSHAPPPRPNLRAISANPYQQRPPASIPSRPALQRVPPPQSAYSQQNPESLLRQSPPPSATRTSPQELMLTIQLRMREMEEEVTKLNTLAVANRTNAEAQERIARDKMIICKNYDQLRERLAMCQQQQRQQTHQLQLQRHLQMTQQQQQQQQMRQQQLQQQQQQQQQQQRGPPGVIGSKRPSIESYDTRAPPKQGRVEMPDLPEVRLPNGVTFSALPRTSQDYHQSPPPAHAASSGASVVITPGQHSGGSTGSRHSSNSGTTSPAMISPGSVASRLAQSGITLTPASPTQQPLSPPQNPILSPISDCTGSPRGSPRISGPTVIQRVPSAGSGSPQGSPLGEVAFAVPKAPAPQKPAIVTGAERPERPPTIDLTADEMQNHAAQMRATGGGQVTQEQINQHEMAMLQQRIRMAGGVPPPQQQPQRKTYPCPNCNGVFASLEILNDHRLRVHGHAQSQQQFPPPSNHPPHFNPRSPAQTAVRRPSPAVASNPPPHGPLLAHRLDNPPHPNVSLQATSSRAGHLPPTSTSSQLLQHIRTAATIAPQQRPESQSRTADDLEKYVVPLLNLHNLDLPKLRALNEIGVTSFVPLKGIAQLGIPIVRLQQNLDLGHFPHDSAIEIAPIRALNTPPSNNSTQRSIPPVTSPQPNRIAAPTRVPPQGVTSPPVAGGYCNDRNCPDYRQQRPSPGGTIHHTGHSPVQAQLARGLLGGVGGNVPSIHNHNHNHNHPGYAQQQQQQVHHESFLGSQVLSNQLIVTPVNRH